jgi:hypothetical protein
MAFILFAAQAQHEPSAAPDATAFSTSPDKLGAVASSVNLFSGDLTLPMNLVSLPSKEGLGINVSIAYSSNIQNTVDTWNLEAPTGILGLGWSMDIPKIIADTKQTGTREDDTYFILEGGASNRLVRTGSGSDAGGSFYTYQTKNYQFWKIKYYIDSGEISGGSTSGSNKWEITRENGMKYIYGDNSSGRSTIQYTVRWSNWIGNSSQPSGQSQLATAWNLSEINNLWGEKTIFEYTNIDQFVGSSLGQKQTEASYLKQITDPIGRKVQFFYNTKASEFYMEPHTEQPEPDAYQEVYEKKYLDHIDVLQELGAKYLSVYFRYNAINDGTNTAKMLLANIEQRNNQNEAQPGIRFDYYTATDVNGYKGFLKKVTYPTGGSATYTYAMQNPATSNTPYTIGHSNRNLTINAPAADGSGPNGYAEPQIWMAQDYVIVAWRSLGSTKAHDTGSQTVKLFVYQWVGEWKVQFLQTINSVQSKYIASQPAFQAYSEYNDFQVVSEDKFFGVLSHPRDNIYDMFLFYKDENTRSNWLSFSTTIDYGSGLPTLLSGNDFVVVGSNQDDSTHPCHLYTFQGNAWKDDILNQTSGDHYYTSGHNYFFSHNRVGTSGLSEMNFSYLTEEKSWITKNWSNALTFGVTRNKSYWHGSNSYIVAMASDNPEFIYRWDLTYGTFFRDNNVLGSKNDNSYVFNVNNSMIGITQIGTSSNINGGTGVAARFDGLNWISTTDINAYTYWYMAYGNDYALASQFDGSYHNYRRFFDPNRLVWSDIDMPSNSGYRPIAGQDFFTFLGNIYLRKPDGTWNQINSNNGDIGGNNYFINKSIKFIKNGGLGGSDSYGIYPYFFRIPGSWYKDLYSPTALATFSTAGTTARDGNNQISSAFCDATSINLFRILGFKANGFQVDYPVRSITTNDGTTDRITAIDYNFSTASIDPSGNYAQYNEVTVIPGGGSISTNDSGYTKTFFNNGLTSNDDSAIPTVLPFLPIDLHWVGQPYQTIVYDKNNTQVANTKNYYTVTPVNLLNSASVQVDVAYYVRPLSVRNLMDGVERITDYTYDANTGQVRTQQIRNASNSSPVSSVEYAYWYEKYDATKSRNLLTPVVQVSKAANGIYTEAQVTRWKNWNAFGASGSTAPAPYDNLVWRGTNSYAFSAWDATISPTTLADWMYTGKIVSRDDYSGIELETLARGNIPSATLYDIYKIRPIATIANASYGQVAYTSFEYTENYSNWSIADGSRASSVELGKTGEIFFQVGPIGITKNNLQPEVKYTLSFWAKANSGTLLIDGVGAITIPYKPDWTYFEYTVTNINSLTIKLSGSTIVSIDELRLCPVNSRMSTSTYHLVYGPTSQTDANGRTIYTQYDSWGRPQNQLDENLNVIKTYTYNTKK